MARRKRSSSSPLMIGNCKVEVEGSGLSTKATTSSLFISFPNKRAVKISVVDPTGCAKKKSRNHQLLGHRSNERGEVPFQYDNMSFLLLNPKDTDSSSKLFVQEVLALYMKELPAMNYAANTGKESMFLEKCVSSGKYRTLLLISSESEGCSQVIAAMSYQIIPTDTQYAEIPVAAVHPSFQNKGIGHYLYEELRTRLQNVGVVTIFCWGDQESEGFWLKQGFVLVAKVDTKGRIRKLPIKADIRRALCFPGGSMFMVSHLKRDTSICSNLSRQRISRNPMTSSPISTNNAEERKENYDCDIPRNDYLLSSVNGKTDHLQYEVLEKEGYSVTKLKDLLVNNEKDFEDSNPCHSLDLNKSTADLGLEKNERSVNVPCSCSSQREKKRIWKASLSSLKSKKVKGGHNIGCNLESSSILIDKSNQVKDSDYGDYSFNISKDEQRFRPLSLAGVIRKDNVKVRNELPARRPMVMLMDISDESKKSFLTKVVEDLGGTVTSNGSAATHIITGKARGTLNFCIALSSGAWVVSPNWLKTCFREGSFVGEFPFVLRDEEYMLKYKSELKDAVLRARARAGALLKEYDVCIAKQVQPTIEALSAIVKSAGGTVLDSLDSVLEPSRTIFVACENMDEALAAVKQGVWTYNSDWFMSCVMRQELDFDAPQFAESL